MSKKQLIGELNQLQIIEQSLHSDPSLIVVGKSGLTLPLERGQDLSIDTPSDTEGVRLLSRHRFDVAPSETCFDIEELEQIRLGLVPELLDEDSGRGYLVLSYAKFDKLMGQDSPNLLRFGMRSFEEVIGTIAISKIVKISQSLPEAYLESTDKWEVYSNIDLKRRIDVFLYPSVDIAKSFKEEVKSIEESGGSAGVELTAKNMSRYQIPELKETSVV